MRTFNLSSQYMLYNDLKWSEYGFVVSDGTLNPFHLLESYFDILHRFHLEPSFKEEAKEILQKYFDGKEDEINMETVSELINDFYDYFNEVIPENFYFGSLEGDGACIGFFPLYQEEEEDIPL